MITRRSILRGLLGAPMVITTPGLLMPVRGVERWGVALTSMPHPGTLADAMAGDFDTENLRYTCTEQAEIDIVQATRRLMPRELR